MNIRGKLEIYNFDLYQYRILYRPLWNKYIYVNFMHLRVLNRDIENHIYENYQ